MIDKRIEDIILKGIKKYNLDLYNLVVFTEAATGNYKYTPIIGALAGARKIYAVAEDSKYGSKEQIKNNIIEAAKHFSVDGCIEVLFDKEEGKISQSDIITNSGFVRPIDKQMISLMKSTAVIPLMWETWELREDELDLNYCKEKEILVLGTNERQGLLRLDVATGFLVYKILFNYGYEIYNDKILLISGCPTGDFISDAFIQNSVKFNRIVLDYVVPLKYKKSIIDHHDVLDRINDYDIILLAEHKNKNLLIGRNGILEPSMIKSLNPNVQIIHLCGSIDEKGIKKEGLNLFPKEPAPFGYMSLSADYLGPRAVIELNIAGLKVGEAMARARLSGMNIHDATKYALEHSPAMDFT